MTNVRTFTIEEVRKLVINAYEVGLLDGEGKALENYGQQPTEYINARDFWNKNHGRWLTEPINYIV